MTNSLTYPIEVANDIANIDCYYWNKRNYEETGIYFVELMGITLKEP
jgi:hypothetical protein